MIGHPYTHEEHARACAQAAAEKRVLRQCVQVHYVSGPQCAVIIDAWDTAEKKPMWKVDLIGEVKGQISFPVRKVRKCGNLDGRCQCEKNLSAHSTNG